MIIEFLWAGFSRGEKSHLKRIESLLRQRVRNHDVQFLNRSALESKLRDLSDRTDILSGAPVQPSGLVIISRQGQLGDLEDIRPSQLVLEVPPPEIKFGRVPDAYVSFLVPRIERAAARVKALASALYNDYVQSPFLLPRRNFIATEFWENFDQLRGRWLDGARELSADGHRSFDDLVSASCSKMKKFRRPRRGGGGSRAYMDERGMRFQFAAQAQHGADPSGQSHPIPCQVNGYFRLGCRINSAHHFDVTHFRDERWTGQSAFQCHGARTPVNARYTNIWTNDFRIDRK
jgi:hypothetical protein